MYASYQRSPLGTTAADFGPQQHVYKPEISRSATHGIRKISIYPVSTDTQRALTERSMCRIHPAATLQALGTRKMQYGRCNSERCTTDSALRTVHQHKLKYATRTEYIQRVCRLHSTYSYPRSQPTTTAFIGRGSLPCQCHFAIPHSAASQPTNSTCFTAPTQ